MLKLAVIGQPIKHSQSPWIHQQFARALGLKINYQRIAAGKEKLAVCLKQLQSEGYTGVNITHPGKQLAYALVDKLTTEAKQAQAVNTVCFKPNGRRLGANTDGIGLLRDLTQNKSIHLANKSVLLLGAGGAVSAILPALLAEGPRCISIANRSLARAQALIARLPSGETLLQACHYTTLPELVFDLVIDGTSFLPQALPMAGLQLTKNAVFYDLKYLKSASVMRQWAASQAFAHVYGGWGMLVEQAAESFKLWTGLKPETRLLEQPKC